MKTDFNASVQQLIFSTCSPFPQKSFQSEKMKLGPLVPSGTVVGAPAANQPLRDFLWNYSNQWNKGGARC